MDQFRPTRFFQKTSVFVVLERPNSKMQFYFIENGNVLMA
jgi:hypothetical protein